MIRYLHRSELSLEKYDAVVHNAPETRLYGMSWYLDIVADDWGAFIYGNYEAVMPVPFMKALKYFNRKRILQPFLCQQLGMFSTIDEPAIFDAFLTEFLNKQPVHYQFNASNPISAVLTTKVNFELALHRPYKTIRSEFRKDRKYRINQAKKIGLTCISPMENSMIIEIAKEHYSIKTYSKTFFTTLDNLVTEVVKRDCGFLLYVLLNDEVVGAALFLKSENRITYLFSAFTAKGREVQASSFLLNEVIESYAGNQLILDFEGSSIPSIASFFRSFGAQEKPYPVLQL